MSEVIPFKKPGKPQDLMFSFLGSPGHKRDADFFFSHYQTQKPGAFVLLVIEKGVLTDDIEPVLFEIRYLTRLELFPVVVICDSKAELEKLEVEAYFRKAKLALSFISNECSAREKKEFVAERVSKGLLPMFHFSSTQNLAKNLVELAQLLQSTRILFVRPNGPIVHRAKNHVLPLLDCPYTHKPGELNEVDQNLVVLCEEIIQNTPYRILLAIVAPNNILRELFTVKGAGTRILRTTKLLSRMLPKNLDPHSMAHLVKMTFNGTLDTDLVSKTVNCCYLEENYTGAALLQDFKNRAYLSMFAVDTEARSLGVGRLLWEHLIQEHKKVFWRSNPNDFITQWYIKQCDGLHKTNNWIIFWKGLAPNEISEAIAFAFEQPSLVR